MWTMIIVVCLIFPMIATPINKIVDRHVTNRVLAYIVQLLIDCTILLALVGIFHLLGFTLWG